MEVIAALFFVWYMLNTLTFEPQVKIFITVLFVVLILLFAFGPPLIGHPFFVGRPL